MLKEILKKIEDNLNTQYKALREENTSAMSDHTPAGGKTKEQVTEAFNEIVEKKRAFNEIAEKKKAYRSLILNIQAKIGRTRGKDPATAEKEFLGEIIKNSCFPDTVTRTTSSNQERYLPVFAAEIKGIARTNLEAHFKLSLLQNLPAILSSKSLSAVKDAQEKKNAGSLGGPLDKAWSELEKHYLAEATFYENTKHFIEKNLDYFKMNGKFPEIEPSESEESKQAKNLLAYTLRITDDFMDLEKHDHIDLTPALGLTGDELNSVIDGIMKGYDLALMLPDDKKLDKNILYLKLEGSTLHYRCITPEGSVEEGTIEWSELIENGADRTLEPKVGSLDDFKAIKNYILNVTSKRRHAQKGHLDSIVGPVRGAYFHDVGISHQMKLRYGLGQEGHTGSYDIKDCEAFLQFRSGPYAGNYTQKVNFIDGKLSASVIERLGAANTKEGRGIYLMIKKRGDKVQAFCSTASPIIDDWTRKTQVATCGTGIQYHIMSKDLDQFDAAKVTLEDIQDIKAFSSTVLKKIDGEEISLEGDKTAFIQETASLAESKHSAAALFNELSPPIAEITAKAVVIMRHPKPHSPPVTPPQDSSPSSGTCSADTDRASFKPIPAASGDEKRHQPSFFSTKRQAAHTQSAEPTRELKY